MKNFYIFLMGACLATVDAPVMAHPETFDSQTDSTLSHLASISKENSSFKDMTRPAVGAVSVLWNLDSLPPEMLGKITGFLGFRDSMNLRHTNQRMLCSVVPDIKNQTIENTINGLSLRNNPDLEAALSFLEKIKEGHQRLSVQYIVQKSAQIQNMGPQGSSVKSMWRKILSNVLREKIEPNIEEADQLKRNSGGHLKSFLNTFRICLISFCDVMFFKNYRLETDDDLKSFLNNFKNFLIAFWDIRRVPEESKKEPWFIEAQKNLDSLSISLKNEDLFHPSLTLEELQDICSEDWVMILFLMHSLQDELAQSVGEIPLLLSYQNLRNDAVAFRNHGISLPNFLNSFASIYDPSDIFFGMNHFSVGDACALDPAPKVQDVWDYFLNCPEQFEMFHEYFIRYTLQPYLPSAEEEQLKVFRDLIDRLAPQWKGDPKFLTEQQKKTITKFVSFIGYFPCPERSFAELANQICPGELDRLCQGDLGAYNPPIVMSVEEQGRRELNYNKYRRLLKEEIDSQRERFADHELALGWI